MNWAELSRRFANYLVNSEKVRGIERAGRIDGHCPRASHDDKSPSFSYYIESAGWKCSCGKGKASDLIKELGLSLEGGLDVDSVSHNVVKEYNYLDEQGAILYQVQRLIPKSFRQRSADKDGQWREGKGAMKDVRRVPYCLPEILNSPPEKTLLIVDGEKDVDAAWDLGVPATCHVGGMANWRQETASLLGRRQICIIADKDSDQTGLKDATRLKSLLEKENATASILQLPGSKVKDLSDWIQEGGTLEKLFDLIEKRELWEDVAKSPIVKAIDLKDLIDSEIAYIVRPVCPRASLTILQGAPKSGKSVFSLYLALCSSLGSWPEGGFECRQPIKTLLIEFEDSPILMMKRASRYLRGLGHGKYDIPENFLYCDYPDLWLDSEKHKALLVSEIKRQKIGLVVLDTLSYIHRARDENSSGDMKPVMANLKRIAKESGASLLLIHHTGKSSNDKNVSEKGRGSSVIAAAADVILDWGDRKKTNITPVSFLSKYDDGFDFKVEYQPMEDGSVEWELRFREAPEESKSKETLVQQREIARTNKAKILELIKAETLISPIGFPIKQFIKEKCDFMSEGLAYREIRNLEKENKVSVSLVPGRGGPKTIRFIDAQKQ